ncbi:hypothetical protein VDBG_03639 [Verticillium alfalfae VaMs.102]|uniref:Uncharacterized protein n=1 Tax=Verticillium alfalfae (strain VaMs.102 / ATCC MYA-4576 / FGSC 10136) TaxID=526221 RepID=C9SGL3_VERA1|nr:hypothetical protein VDBG_03639 [Verticillium alfalfae VaMs.102]EEY17530.1 hypothetical protein VDBG_03639 [Verticillium alfalfae VaMs.102]
MRRQMQQCRHGLHLAIKQGSKEWILPIPSVYGDARIFREPHKHQSGKPFGREKV